MLCNMAILVCKETTIERVSSCFCEVFFLLAFSLHVTDNPLPSKSKFLKYSS